MWHPVCSRTAVGHFYARGGWVGMVLCFLSFFWGGGRLLQHDAGHEMLESFPICSFPAPFLPSLVAFGHLFVPLVEPCPALEPTLPAPTLLRRTRHGGSCLRWRGTSCMMSAASCTSSTASHAQLTSASKRTSPRAAHPASPHRPLTPVAVRARAPRRLCARQARPP